MAKSKNNIVKEVSVSLRDKPHEVSTINFHYGTPDAEEKDNIFKMSFSAVVQEVPKSIQNFKCSFNFTACLEILKTNGNAPMAAYIEKVLEDIGDIEMKEIEMMRVLVEEGFQFDKFIEGVIFKVNFCFENVPLEEGEEWPIPQKSAE